MMMTWTRLIEERKKWTDSTYIYQVLTNGLVAIEEVENIKYDIWVSGMSRWIQTDTIN